jgi:hypothetical protein
MIQKTEMEKERALGKRVKEDWMFFKVYITRPYNFAWSWQTLRNVA